MALTVSSNVPEADSPPPSAGSTSPVSSITKPGEQTDWEYCPGPKYYYAHTVFAFDPTAGYIRLNQSPQQYIVDDSEDPSPETVRRVVDPATGIIRWTKMNGEPICEESEGIEIDVGKMDID